MADIALLILLCFISSVPSSSHAQAQGPPFKAVNLGNWLVIEGWMKPSLFDEIPNKDLLDGTQVQLKSTNLNKYLVAENGGGSNLAANRPSASGWETFTLWRVSESYFNFRVFNKQFVEVRNQQVGATSNTAGYSQTFQIVRNDANRNRIRIKASNGMFIQAKSENLVTADYQGPSNWDDNNPSVFEMNSSVKTLRGEYQITNGYGPNNAPRVLRNHWNTYITEDDFRFLSENGLNAVRIPVGWWIAKDPNPPKPFVGGSSEALDRAFTWAEKYGMKVIIDLHAVKASQNGNEHSGTRDGYQEWGDSDIDETVGAIDYLARRYGNRQGLGAIELMNEPVAPGVTFEALKKYYQAGYDTVRKYTSTAYVIFSNRLGDVDAAEFLSFASNLNRVVIDVHYYNLFDAKFDSMSPQENIDYVYNQRASDIRTLTRSNGPLCFVGEWTGAWPKTKASDDEYKRFAKAQLDVFGSATFGWAYWSYKAPTYWSLKWMIENKFIML